MMTKSERLHVRRLLWTLHRYERWMSPKQLHEAHGKPSYQRMDAYRLLLQEAITYLKKRVAKP